MRKQTPSEIARQTLIMLSQRKLQPTPGNYIKIYAEISGVPTVERNGAEKVLRNIADHLSLLNRFTSTGFAIKRSLSEEKWDKCLSEFEKILPSITQDSANAVDALAAETAAVTTAYEHASAMLSTLIELLAKTLEGSVGADPELAEESVRLTGRVRQVKSQEQLVEISGQIRQFWLKVESRSEDKDKVQDGVVRLLRLLVENVGLMVEDETWLHGQIKTLHEIISNPIDKFVVADAEISLRESISKQSQLKQGVVDAKSTIKSLMSTFIDRMSVVATNTGEYHHKMEGYTQSISQSKSMSDLSSVMNDIMQDTRIIQASTLSSHEELLSSRRQVEEAEAKIQLLEKELSEVSELVHQDHLTGALNRHGLDAAYIRETSRVDRNKSPLCIALLDIDNFKQLNDSMGHQMGDKALVHLCETIKKTLRTYDYVARYGGEEFVIILPDVELKDAASAIERLQRELTKQFFMNADEKVLITFSAGVAQRTVGESQKTIIGRADKAMYQAKRTGKNRVVMAE
jgi:diguanylate cyclase